MQIALKVLAAVTDLRSPDPADATELRNVAADLTPDLPIDDVACMVVRRTLRKFELEHLRLAALKRSA